MAVHADPSGRTIAYHATDGVRLGDTVDRARAILGSHCVITPDGCLVHQGSSKHSDHFGIAFTRGTVSELDNGYSFG